MIAEYNVSDHWREDEPAWTKALLSSLDRRDVELSTLPLTVAVDEVLRWVELASGVDAWVSGDNRRSLKADVSQSAEALGDALTVEIKRPLGNFLDAFARLCSSPKAVLRTPPGMRTDSVWTDVASSAGTLIASLSSEAAVGATWDDLVASAQDETRDDREHQPIADLLFDQLRVRGVDPERAFRHLGELIAFGRSPEDSPFKEMAVPPEERVALARGLVCAPAVVESVVVWLGYTGHAFPHMNAGNVSFLDAHWAVPNASPDGQAFPHKDELWSLVESGYLFKVATLVGEPSAVDALVRVNLGHTTEANAVARAVAIVETIVNISIHHSGGSRPHMTQSAVLLSGRPGYSSVMTSTRATGFANDRYGASVTADAIREFGPRIAAALSRGELPRFLAAALEVQTAAEHPFSRDMVLRKPSEADIRSIIPLGDRVVQHIAAHAAMKPDDAFQAIGEWWPYVRWLGDVRRAVHMCIAPPTDRGLDDLRHDLTSKVYSSTERDPFLLLVADRSTDFLSLCRVESDRRWIERVFRSVSDYPTFSAIRDKHTRDRDVLEVRRKRTRNALVHGNPAGFGVVESVQAYAEFISGWALHAGLEAFAEGVDPASVLGRGHAEFIALSNGIDAATYWRTRLESA